MNYSIDTRYYSKNEKLEYKTNFVFKLKNGYSAITIFNKDESLRGAMFCATREQNLSFFENVKFTNIEVIQQNFMFEGYMMTNI